MNSDISDLQVELTELTARVDKLGPDPKNSAPTSMACGARMDMIEKRAAEEAMRTKEVLVEHLRRMDRLSDRLAALAHPGVSPEAKESFLSGWSRGDLVVLRERIADAEGYLRRASAVVERLATGGSVDLAQAKELAGRCKGLSEWLKEMRLHR